MENAAYQNLVLRLSRSLEVPVGAWKIGFVFFFWLSQRTGAAEKVPFSAVCLIIIIRGLYGIRLGKRKVGQPGWTHARLAAGQQGRPRGRYPPSGKQKTSKRGAGAVIIDRGQHCLAKSEMEMRRHNRSGHHFLPSNLSGPF